VADVLRCHLACCEFASTRHDVTGRLCCLCDSRFVDVRLLIDGVSDLREIVGVAKLFRIQDFDAICELPKEPKCCCYEAPVWMPLQMQHSSSPCLLKRSLVGTDNCTCFA